MRDLVLVVLAGCAASAAPAPSEEQLGKLVFEDPSLSSPAGQACRDCHDARSAFRDPESDHSTSAGAVAGRFGLRNAPSAMYARFVPALHGKTGGLFWDGRADTLQAQAAGPMLNPLEMNNADKAAVVAKVRAAGYARQFRDIYGADALDDVDRAFAHVGDALAAYERSDALAPFTAKYDRAMAGLATFTDAEARGLGVFGAHCASCHPPPLFTNFSYANLGIPRYDNNKFYVQPAAYNPDGARYVDHGLMATTHDPVDDGKFRVPSLRNVARTGPYGHNGYFANLPFMLSFLATRDTGSREVANCSRATPEAICAWPAPEVQVNVDPRVGHLPLSEQNLDDLAAFLGTLTDEH